MIHGPMHIKFDISLRSGLYKMGAVRNETRNHER